MVTKETSTQAKVFIILLKYFNLKINFIIGINNGRNRLFSDCKLIMIKIILLS
jgi:hypothetical protein